jgi:hypothetical protein
MTAIMGVLRVNRLEAQRFEAGARLRAPAVIPDARERK